MAERAQQVLLQTVRVHPQEAVRLDPGVVHSKLPIEHPLAQYLLRDRFAEVQAAEPIGRRGVFLEEQVAALQNMEYIVAAQLVSLVSLPARERRLGERYLELREAIATSDTHIPETLMEDIIHQPDLSLEMDDNQQVVIAGFTPQETQFVIGKLGRMILSQAGYDHSSLREESLKRLTSHILPALYDLTFLKP